MLHDLIERLLNSNISNCLTVLPLLFKNVCVAITSIKIYENQRNVY